MNTTASDSMLSELNLLVSRVEQRRFPLPPRTKFQAAAYKRCEQEWAAALKQGERLEALRVERDSAIRNVLYTKRNVEQLSEQIAQLSVAYEASSARDRLAQSECRAIEYRQDQYVRERLEMAGVDLAIAYPVPATTIAGTKLYVTRLYGTLDYEMKWNITDDTLAWQYVKISGPTCQYNSEWRKEEIEVYPPEVEFYHFDAGHMNSSETRVALAVAHYAWVVSRLMAYMFELNPDGPTLLPYPIE